MTPTDTPATIVSKLANARSIVVTPHARADPDAIGSAAALTRVLRLLGKKARGFLHEAYPTRYAFMRDLEPLETWQPAQAEAVLADTDLVVIVDTCSRAQLGEVIGSIERCAATRIAIDHHQTRDSIVHDAYIDSTSASTAQLVLAVIDATGAALDRSTAELLFLGLAGDTGWFRFSNADARAFAAASRLIEAGVRPNELYERLYLNDPPPRARLIGAIMSSFELHAENRLAVIRVPRRMLADCGATPDLTEELINEPQRVGTVIAAVMFSEPISPGPIRVNFRSKRGVDVAAMAQRFGGGGHARAAGARIDGTLDEVAAKVVPAMTEAVRAASH